MSLSDLTSSKTRLSLFELSLRLLEDDDESRRRHGEHLNRPGDVLCAVRSLKSVLPPPVGTT